MNKYFKNTLILMLITVVAGVALGGVYNLTKDSIAEQNERVKDEAYRKLFPDAFLPFTNLRDIDKDEINDYILKADNELRRKDKDNKNTVINATIDEVVRVAGSGVIFGYIITVTEKEAYGGEITFMVGVSSDRTITGISFLSIKETPGLGMKAKEAEFMNQFEGKKADYIMYTKGDGSQNTIDAISGATITSNAVSNGVTAALYCYDYLIENDF